MKQIALHATAVGCAALAALCFLSAPAQALDEVEARRLLAARGLEPWQKLWVCQAELQLRRQIDALERLEPAFFVARKELEGLLHQHEQLVEKIKALKKLSEQNVALLKQQTYNLAQRQQLESEGRRLKESLDKLERQLTQELDTALETSPAMRAAVELVNARNALAICLLEMERRYREMSQTYARLKQDNDVKIALKVVGQAGALGPAENYDHQLKHRIERLIGQVFQDRLPIYRRSKQVRLSLILNDRVPATFSYPVEATSTETPTVLPSGLLQLAGIEVDPVAEWKELQIDKRKVIVRAVTIPRLRVGHLLLKNVPAWALPPEAEDLGARLHPATLGPHRAKLDEKRLEFRLVE